MSGRRSALLLSLTLLAGCAIDLVSPENPQSLIPDRSAAIVAGQTRRAELRVTFGEPQLSSLRWGFDLFRTDTEQRNVVVAVTPWPIPFARVTDQLQRYTLVAYDADGLASAVASGVFRRQAAWRNVSPIRHDFPALHLRAGALLFYLDPEGARDVNLLAAPAARDRFLRQAPAAGNCTAVIGCGKAACGDQLAVDGAPPRPLPLRAADTYWFQPGERETWLQDVAPPDDETRMPWLEALVALQLPAGEHQLDFSARHLDGRHSLPFACRSGEVSFLVVNASDKAGLMKSTLVDWQIKRLEALPENFRRRPLVLLDDGQWYVEPD